VKKISYFYDDKMIADADSFSLSPLKPKKLHERVQRLALPMQAQRVKPVSRADIMLSHTAEYVDGVLDCVFKNGFGNNLMEVASALPYIVGAEYCAAVQALRDGVAWAFCSGFHHAHPNHGGGFCTFEGLSITGRMLRKKKLAQRILIVDGDAHFGDGTVACTKDDSDFEYVSYAGRVRASAAAENLTERIERFRPDIILFQDGLDAYKFDTLGGGLTYQELYERTYMICAVAKEYRVPIVLNLAGGYTRLTEQEIAEHHLDIIEPVLVGHINSFIASINVFVDGVDADIMRHVVDSGFWEKRMLFKSDTVRSYDEAQRNLPIDSLLDDFNYDLFERESATSTLVDHLSAAKSEILDVLRDDTYDENTKADLIIEIVAGYL
jgi:acetoin utilization deacetylase AcuC-like enzyme